MMDCKVYARILLANSANKPETKSNLLAKNANSKPAKHFVLAIFANSQIANVDHNPFSWDQDSTCVDRIVAGAKRESRREYMRELMRAKRAK